MPTIEHSVSRLLPSAWRRTQSCSCGIKCLQSEWDAIGAHMGWSQTARNELRPSFENESEKKPCPIVIDFEISFERLD
jgi:hypothetical protein